MESMYKTIERVGFDINFLKKIGLTLQAQTLYLEGLIGNISKYGSLGFNINVGPNFTTTIGNSKPIIGESPALLSINANWKILDKNAKPAISEDAIYKSVFTNIQSNIVSTVYNLMLSGESQENVLVGEYAALIIDTRIIKTASVSQAWIKILGKNNNAFSDYVPSSIFNNRVYDPVDKLYGPFSLPITSGQYNISVPTNVVDLIISIIDDTANGDVINKTWSAKKLTDVSNDLYQKIGNTEKLITATVTDWMDNSTLSSSKKVTLVINSVYSSSLNRSLALYKIGDAAPYLYEIRVHDKNPSKEYVYKTYSPMSAVESITDVADLSGSLKIEYGIAKVGLLRLVQGSSSGDLIPVTSSNDYLYKTHEKVIKRIDNLSDAVSELASIVEKGQKTNIDLTKVYENSANVVP